jgi:two-component system cell cycle response regulator
VESDDVARESIVAAVRLLGHKCRSAKDGLEAWQMQQQQCADVIVCDWQTPRMDGLELCRRTRVAKDNGTYTYFILLASFTDKAHFICGMEAGADDYHTKPVDLDELRARLVSAGRVLAAYRELADKNASLRLDSQASFRVARVDALTQVQNRLSLQEDLAALWSRVKRYGHGYSIAMIDVDRFKDYNDHFGHIAGDDVLRRIASTIRQGLRAGDGLYRYGGEEFVVLLPEQPLSEGVRVMDRARVAVEQLAIDTKGQRPLTISLGVAQLDLSVDKTPQDWLSRADRALYCAKAGGRNRVEADSQPKG